MAYTVTRYKTVFGNKAAVGMVITADAATQTIETGLKKVEWISIGAVSMNSSNFHCAFNSNASGVQSFGVFAITGLTSGDNLCVTVYGQR
jgi:hypothetical protein